MWEHMQPFLKADGLTAPSVFLPLWVMLIMANINEVR